MSLQSFNSRTLGRVRPERQNFRQTFSGVSIHAPWEGCDDKRAEAILNHSEFQFTHPGKGATQSCVSLPSPTSVFQFTHPGKGATAVTFSTLACISCFNSRTLGRVRQTCQVYGSVSVHVSIHAPWEGCDVIVHLLVGKQPVSIHAPWEGCDSVVQSCVL